MTQCNPVDLDIGVEVAVKPAGALPDLRLGQAGPSAILDEPLLGIWPTSLERTR